MFKRYAVRLIFRICIFLTVFWVYLFRNEWMDAFLTFNIINGITPVFFLWLILMWGMIQHLIPVKLVTMGQKKQLSVNYIPPDKPYDRLELLEYVQKQNISAWKVMLVWISANAVIAILFLANIIGEKELIMFTMFYFLSDLVCVLIFCPFQTFFMKGRCCISCRIFDWGHFMMYTPMILIKSFFSWSLFFMSVVVLLKWEINYARHPERFWEGSNVTLRCKNCTDKLCKIKKPFYKNKEDRKRAQA